MFPSFRATVSAVSLLVLACDPSRTPDEGGDLHDASTDPRDASDAAQSHADNDGGLPQPLNESFEMALPLTEAGVLEDVVHVAQENYFMFDAQAGSYYEFQTSIADFSADVVISLYDAQHTLIAQNDDGSRWPGDTLDARLVARISQAGRYFVKVSDPYTPAGYFSSRAFFPLYYALGFRELKAGSEGVTFEDGSKTSVTFALDEASGYSYATVLGTLSNGAVHSFSLVGLSDQALIGHVLASGVSGNGSSAGPGPVQVLDANQSLLAEVAGTEGHLEIFPPITEGTYELRLSEPESVGENAFYALDLVMLPDNPREQFEQENGELSHAEAITFTGVSRRRGLVLSDVPGGDVDYYSFDAVAGAMVLFSCDGESAGSGVRELHVELRDGSDQTVAVATESPTHTLSIEATTVPAAGTYFLRLTSDYPETNGASPWVRCVILAAP